MEKFPDIVENFQEVLENFPEKKEKKYFFMKNNFQTNINILFCLENFISSGKVTENSRNFSRQYEFIIL